tara:strand:- start:117 stop:791 length:675 start_codon:yes stop_codon:yes gene_type:complete
MAYSFFPNDFNKTPNLQDQLFLMKQKQAAALNEAYLGSERARAAYDARPMPKLIPPAGTVLPQPSLTSVRPAPSSPFKQPRPDGGFPKKEVIDQSKLSGSIAGGLGIPKEAPPKPRRGVTKSGKMITITDPGYTNTSGKLDGSGRRNVNRDKDGNVHITYGVSSGSPEGMSNHGEDYVDVGDDFDDKTSNPTEYYNTKSKQREADMASFKQSLSRGNREKPYIQ